ncbi:hypothetical protein Asera_64050 [Actinocatenispora sera]|uniref:Uncharacterized protein n=2 Tax=Actinocatenispora sera TaxID=390989 RepID=A0A810LAL0_9ACTN|nr:hypothetical protein Asera_64050 [Actinocatenispora sera]
MTDPDPEYETFPQLMQVQLPGVQILADPRHTVKLDSAPKAALWRRRTLQVLRTLSAYVQAKHAARADGRPAGADLATLFSFVRSQQPGALISMRGVAPRESDAVVNTPRLAAHRYFPVPPEVDPTGTLMYVAHIAIGSGRNLAPRLYFHDDTDGPTGQLYVGYIGPHLPNTHTS